MLAPAVNVDFESQSLTIPFPATEQQILDNMNNLPVPQRLNLTAPTSPPICTNVSIIDDDILEQVTIKSFHLDLSHPDPAVTFTSPLRATVTITDDDGERQVG